MDAGIANLKVGDRVAVKNTGGWTNEACGTIVGESTACWRVRVGKNVAGEDIIVLYHKKDGSKRGRGTWCSNRIESDPDGSKVAAIIAERARSKKASGLKNTVIWEELTMAQLEAIEKIVSGN
jgi:hypothetical protein